MIQETHSSAADASKRASARSNTTDLIEDEDTLSAAAHERATKQQEQTSQYFSTQLPKEKPEGGKGEGRADPLSIYLAQGRQPEGTTGQQVSQDLSMASSERHGPGKNAEGALQSMNTWADASIHHPGQAGASSMYLQESLFTDKPTRQRRDFARADHIGLTSLGDNIYDIAMNTIKMNERPLCEKKSRMEVAPDCIRSVRIDNSSMSLCDKLVFSWCSRWGGGCLVEGNALRSSSINGSRHKRSTYLCMCRIFMLIALIVASMDLRVMMFADAAFAPRTRTELQGDGQGSTLGVFGCVGSCGGSLSGSGDSTYCGVSGGSWRSGSGNPCKNAGSAVPSNQGTGTYGTMGSWDVSRVDNMRYSKFVPSSFYQCESF